jgi:hypothetical protein
MGEVVRMDLFKSGEHEKGYSLDGYRGFSIHEDIVFKVSFDEESGRLLLAEQISHAEYPNFEGASDVVLCSIELTEDENEPLWQAQATADYWHRQVDGQGVTYTHLAFNRKKVTAELLANWLERGVEIADC